MHQLNATNFTQEAQVLPACRPAGVHAPAGVAPRHHWPATGSKGGPIPPLTHGKGALAGGLGGGEVCIHFRDISIICYQFPLVTCGTKVDELNKHEPSVLALCRHKTTLRAVPTPEAEQEPQASTEKAA